MSYDEEIEEQMVRVETACGIVQLADEMEALYQLLEHSMNTPIL